jgi:two-component system LytT family response regulator
MVNCIIVDDEQHSIDILVHHIRQTSFLNLIATSTSAVEALDIINNKKVDLIFQDIQLPDLSGIDVIKAINGKCKVILTTAYSEFALQGYELDVVDYLLKPISFARFIKAVQKAMNLLQVPGKPATNESTEDDHIYVKTGIKGKVLKINLHEVDYIESLKNYVAIHHAGQKTLVYLNMKELEAKLPERKFIRVHKSFIISASRIVRVEGNQIILKNINADILLGDTYREKFLEMIKNKTIG